ncbi:MAG TPA: class I SAM-dependent methyltransferase [Phycisphaerales bacterium]|nr:class I SAM-dependent methyltransferase [Phycisphaerales bacterium]
MTSNEHLRGSPTAGSAAGEAAGAKPGKAHEHAAKRDWPAYFAAVEGKPARDTLLKALDLFEREDAAGGGKRERLAVDLGCGSGRDTLELLGRGWRVLAIDSSPLAVELLKKKVVAAEQRSRLETRVAGFEGLKLPRVELVNASYALPFCDPGAFEALWREIVGAIPVGGRFAGQFFGERDGWASLPDRTHHTRDQVNAMLREFNLEDLKEIENREAGVTGEVKDWHIFHVVARRRV